MYNSIHDQKRSILNNCPISIFMGAPLSMSLAPTKTLKLLPKVARPEHCDKKYNKRHLLLDGLRVIRNIEDCILLLLCPDNT